MFQYIGKTSPGYKTNLSDLRPPHVIKKNIHFFNDHFDADFKTGLKFISRKKLTEIF